MKSHRLLAGLLLFAFQSIGLSQSNNWTSSFTGNWHDLSWSLGVRPSSNHWVSVTNSGSKAVFVNSATRDNYPGSMSISNLTLSAPTDATNTILLNFTGTSVPLKVANNCYVGTNGVLMNLFGGLTVGGPIVIEGGSMIQEGGSNICGSCQVGTDFGFGKYSLSNGVLRTDYLDLDSDKDGSFEQSGGETWANTISVGGHFWGSTFHASNGVVRAGNISVRYGSFSQINSDVICSNGISISQGGDYWISGGSLTCNGTSVGGGTSGSMSLSGGMFKTGGLYVSGDTYFAHPSFHMSGGVLIADEIVRTRGGFSQDGGTISASGNISGGISLSGGLLMSSNTSISDGYFPVTFTQTGGTNITTNDFSVSGISYQIQSQYILAAGRLDVGNLILNENAYFTRQGGSFTNRHQVIFSGGRLFPELSEEFFGALKIETPRTIGSSSLNLPANNCVVRFANSADVAWDPAAILEILGWNGSINGGGTHQLWFGTNGLNPTQLEQIVFVDPQGLSHGNYSGSLLPSGELVPATFSVALHKTASGLILMWPGSQQLQSATNVNGPYLPVSGGYSPYSISTGEQKRFFRLAE